MIDRIVRNRGDCLVVGVVRGLVSEVAPLLHRLEEFAPSAIGLGVSTDDAREIREQFVASGAEPLVSLVPSEAAEIRGLARYGEVRVPNPVIPAVLAWGEGRGIPVEPVDPSDDTYSEMFAEHIGYFELVRRTLRERRLSRRPPAPPTADDFALAWSRPPSERGGSARLIAAREAAAIASVRALCLRHGRVAFVVDRERFEGAASALAAE